MLLLSAGGFVPRLDNFSALAVEAELTAMSLMGYDAATLGHRELALDSRILDDQIAVNRIPVVCSNLFCEGALYGQKYVLEHRGPLTIGIVAVVASTREESQASPTVDHWTIGDPDSSLRSAIQGADSSANILILLSQMGLWKSLELIEEFPQIDVAIVGDEGRTIREPIQYRSSLVVLSGNRGQYLGRLDLTFDDNGGLLRYQGELIPLNDTIPDDPEIAALVAEFKNRVEELASDASDAMPNTSNAPGNVAEHYVGDAICQDCHSWIYARWQVTPHRDAFQSLRQERQTLNRECIPCHVVGYGQGGFSDLDVTPHLVDVQCESCHGKGSNHVATPQVAMPGVVSETICLSCHCGKWGEDFDFSTAAKSVH